MSSRCVPVRRIRVVALALTIAGLAACGGGGGSVPAAGTAKTQSQAQTGSATIAIPTATVTSAASASRARYPQFISPNALSVTLSINGGAAQAFDVGPTSTLCITSSGLRTCTIGFSAPVGRDTLAFTIFSGPSGTGSTLASATATQPVAAGTPFGFSLSMNAAVGTVMTTLVPGTDAGQCTNHPQNSQGISEGCPGSATLQFTAFDPSGAQITGTTPYAAAIAIAASDPAVNVSPTSIMAPGQGVTVSYAGGPLASTTSTSVTFALSAGGQAIGAPTVPVSRAFLYVANTNAPEGTTPAGGGNIAVYAYGATGSATPARTIAGTNTLLYNPVMPVLDASGALYVLDNNNSNPEILKFAPGANGNVAPVASITGIGSLTSNQACDAMTFDLTKTHLFVGCTDGKLHVFAPPATVGVSAASAQTASLFSSTFDLPSAIAFDNSGNLYVADISYNSVGYYPAPLPVTGTNVQIAATQTMSAGTPWPLIVAPVGLTFDEQGTLYASIASLVPSPGTADASNQLAVWKTTTIPCAACAPGAAFTFSPSIHSPGGIALDYGPNLYSSNPFTNTITVYAAATVSGASGTTLNAPVLRTIATGSSPDGPLGMTVGP